MIEIIVVLPITHTFAITSILPMAATAVIVAVTAAIAGVVAIGVLLIRDSCSRVFPFFLGGDIADESMQEVYPGRGTTAAAVTATITIIGVEVKALAGGVRNGATAEASRVRALVRGGRASRMRTAATTTVVWMPLCTCS